MKRLLWAAWVATLVGAGTACAQGGLIGIYEDVAGIDCAMEDTQSGTVSVHVVHTASFGAKASSFAAPLPACYSGVYLGEAVAFTVSVGNTQSGLLVGYGGSCVFGTIEIVEITVMNQGTTGQCCYWQVVADPGSTFGGVEVLDCADNSVEAWAGQIVINPFPGNGFYCDCVSPTDEETWGGIKALFGN